MSKIEWTEQTWNPVIGCEKISPGCQNCYAEKMAYRIASMEFNEPRVEEKYMHVVEPDTKSWNGKTHLVVSALDKPLKRKKPTTYFVCSMGDLFHESVPFEWIDKVFAVTQKCPQHTFLVLTKRASNMWNYFKHRCIEYPYLNVLLGVTAENQEQADKRIPILLQVPSVKHFVSIEPMLGLVDVSEYLHESICTKEIRGEEGCICAYQLEDVATEVRVDWVICGGESGPGARPMHPEWPLSLSTQCQNAGVPFFFKQWGEWSDQVPMSQFKKAKMVYRDGSFAGELIERGRNATLMARVGKKAAGHLIGGSEYRNRPSN